MKEFRMKDGKGRKPIRVSVAEFQREIIPDESPDSSYLEQDGWEDRRAEYERGEFHFLGVRASVEIDIPHGQCTIAQRITSPGLWGIESDSSADYFGEVFAEESAILADMLAELGIEVEGGKK